MLGIRQLLTVAAMAMASIAARAEFNSLSFTTLAGDTHYIGIEGLEITFAQDNLTAANTTSSVTLPLAQVASMEFCNYDFQGSIDATATDRWTEPTAVYGINGLEIGTYTSFAEAMANVPAGVYVFKYADGTTLKIVKE